MKGAMRCRGTDAVIFAKPSEKKKAKTYAQNKNPNDPFKRPTSRGRPGAARTMPPKFRPSTIQGTLVLGLEEDILYLDPPYNNRQYGSYYHLYETFVRYDAPQITGKGGLRDWQTESKSDFCSKKTCLATLEDIISRTKAKLIVISYSTDGMMKEEEIIDMLEAKCKSEIAVFRQPQKRYKADNNRENNKSALSELLFVVERRQGKTAYYTEHGDLLEQIGGSDNC